MKIIPSVFSLYSIIFFVSCSSIEQKAIEGDWSIDEIHFDQYDIRRCMLVNQIIFRNETCVLPDFTNCQEHFVDNSMGIWRFEKNDSVPVVLKINSENEVFNGFFKVVFEKDSELKLFRMTLISETTFISLRKGFFNFDNDIDKFEDIIELSQKGIE